MANDTEVPSILQLTLDGPEFHALMASSLGFLTCVRSDVALHEKQDAIANGTRAIESLGADRWNALITRCIRLSDVAFPGQFGFEQFGNNA